MFFRSIHAKLDAIFWRIGVLERLFQIERTTIMSALDDLAVQVKANTDAEASAIQLIHGLADELAAAATDPAKVAALSAQLKASADALAAAVVANTPATAPAPPADAPPPADVPPAA